MKIELMSTVKSAITRQPGMLLIDIHVYYSISAKELKPQ